MNPYAIGAAVLAGIVLAVGLAFGGYKAGVGVTEAAWEAKEIARVEKIVVRDHVVEREVPKIVERVVTRTVTVEKEVERVRTVVEKSIPADCVLPDRYGLLLVAAARGLDPDAPGSADALAGTYGCRETLDATLADLKAGWINTERLAGLQEYVRVITAPLPKGNTP